MQDISHKRSTGQSGSKTTTINHSIIININNNGVDSNRKNNKSHQMREEISKINDSEKMRRTQMGFNSGVDLLNHD
jgi:hypothetical protein